MKFKKKYAFIILIVIVSCYCSGYMRGFSIQTYRDITNSYDGNYKVKILYNDENTPYDVYGEFKEKIE